MFYETTSKSPFLTKESWDGGYFRFDGITGVPVEIEPMNIELFGTSPITSEAYEFDPIVGKMIAVKSKKESIPVPEQQVPVA